MKFVNKSLLVYKLVIATALCILTNAALYSQEKELVIGEQPVYKVAKARGPIIIDGKMDDEAWMNAEVVSFDNFFRTDKPVDKQKSKFRMLWDSAYLYLFYEFEDTSLTARETNFDARPYLDDCAEFFVVPIPDSVYMHFGFEVNITKAKYDYIVLWRYYNNRTIFVRDYNPEYKVESTYDGTINNDKDKDKGWKMEFQIPIDVFTGFQFITRPRPGARWAFQAVRQDRNLIDDRFRSTSTLYPIYNYRLDVHQPAHFGLMEFSE